VVCRSFDEEICRNSGFVDVHAAKDAMSKSHDDIDKGNQSGNLNEGRRSPSGLCARNFDFPQS
jgi:hypothetical protein